MKLSIILKNAPVYLVAVLVCIVLISPIAWMFSCSFKTAKELYSSGISLVPRMPTVENYVVAFRDFAVAKWLFNSVIITLGITSTQLVTSILAGYGFARFSFRLKNLLFLVVIGTMIVPFAVTMIPNYILIASLSGINTYWGTIIPHSASGFGIFLLRQHMMSIPRDLFDAAKIDGANSWTVLWGIAVPVTKAAIVALSILLGLNAWNIYFWPMLILSKIEMQTIPIGLSNFADPEFGILWGVLMATASVASLFALTFYAIGQKHILGSFTISGLKG